VSLPLYIRFDDRKQDVINRRVSEDIEVFLQKYLCKSKCREGATVMVYKKLEK